MVEVKTIHSMSTPDLLRRLGLNLYQATVTKIDQIVVEEGTVKIYTTRLVKHQPPRQKEPRLVKSIPEVDTTGMESTD